MEHPIDYWRDRLLKATSIDQLDEIYAQYLLSTDLTKVTDRVFYYIMGLYAGLSRSFRRTNF